jgi:hypothetical protein
MKIAASLLPIGLLFGISNALSCPAFREPPIDFRGLKTDQEVTAYWTSRVYPQLTAQTAALETCVANDSATRPEERRMQAVQFKASMERFREQFKAAAKAHLGLLAAQPVAGAYTDVSSTGSHDNATPNDTNTLDIDEVHRAQAETVRQRKAEAAASGIEATACDLLFFEGNGLSPQSPVCRSIRRAPRLV